MPSTVINSETTREEAVNTLLARMLKGYGASARAERRSRMGTPDVRVELKTKDSVVLECKWEGSKIQLERQLDKRLKEFPDTLGLFGILYPDHLRRVSDVEAALEDTDRLQWWLHGSRGQKVYDRHIHTGSVSEFSDQMRALPLTLEGADSVLAATGVVGYAVERAAERVANHARVSQLIVEAIARTDQEKDRSAARRIGCLVLFNALAFHDRLAGINENVPTIRETWGESGINGLRETWVRICEEIDYVPVFELAIGLLDILRNGPEEVFSPTIRFLIRAVEDTRQLEGHDLSGRLFHTLLTDAKFTGAYYTSIPAATLLTRLVFHDWPSQVDWADYEFPASLNVADLACGTGTLLIAVAAEAERRHLLAGGQKVAELHKAMVEQALRGYDVQLSAVHFAATGLAMLNPDIEFNRMNLYVMPLGVSGSNVSLGSLEFLGRDIVPAQYALSPEEFGIAHGDVGRVSASGMRGVEEHVNAELPELDLAIMNPPFTRSVFGNLLFGNVPSTARAKLRSRLSDLLQHRFASSTAGLGSAFVAAASPKLRPGEGRLALVLPATVCTGPSWEQTRTLIERNFVLNMVITSHDPERWNFSDSTDLSEALLIATRRAEGDSSMEHRTTFVNLWQNPDSVVSAHSIAQAITSTTSASLEETGTALLEVSERHVGEVFSSPMQMSSGRQWIGVQFARADLVRSALSLLREGKVQLPGNSMVSEVPICGLVELGQIGPDIRDVHDGFDRTDSVTAYPMVENHDTKVRKHLSTEPDRYLVPLVRPRKGRKLKHSYDLWPKAGRLLLGARFWLNTARVVAMRSSENVLASMWWPVRIEDESTEKALSLWLNSSLGLLTLLATRNTTRGSWVQLKKADLKLMPVLDTRCLSTSQLRRLSNLFDHISEAEFESLPGMVECPARRQLDDGISEILDLPDLTPLSRLLASEPVVSNQPL